MERVDGGASTVALAELGDEDVVGADYVIRSAQGETTRTVTGFSLATMLEAAGVDLFSFNYVAIPRPTGGAVHLDNAQVRDPGAFPDGPPVVYPEGERVRFLRPSSGRGDENAGDGFAADGALRVEVRRGELIEVEARASTVRTKPGRPVSFTATVSRSQAGQALDYSWSFDDGNGGAGRRATHRFNEAGVYAVTVGVTTPTDETGGSDAVTVKVGKVRQGGPDRQGGGENRAADAPDSGRSEGPSGPADGGDGAAGSVGVDGAGAGPRGLAPAPSRRSSLARGSRARPRPGRRAASPRVEGELLDAGASARSDEREPERGEDAVAARTGEPANDGGFTVPGAVLGVLATAALLGLGALRELGRPPLALLGAARLPWPGSARRRK